MTRSVRNTIGFAGLLAIALVTSAGAAQAQGRCGSEDPADAVEELSCGPSDYEPDPNMDPRRQNQTTIVMTPHRPDYSGFPISSVTQFYNGLTPEERQRVVRVAARHGLTTGDDQPMSVEEFGSLTNFIDTEMNDGGFSAQDKRKFLGQLAAEAGVYQGRRDPTTGQAFGAPDGPRYDYSYADAPKR